MDILISLENHPNILQIMDYINNMIIKLSNPQNYRVKITVADKIYLIWNLIIVQIILNKILLIFFLNH